MKLLKAGVSGDALLSASDVREGPLNGFENDGTVWKSVDDILFYSLGERNNESLISAKLCIDHCEE